MHQANSNSPKKSKKVSSRFPIKKSLQRRINSELNLNEIINLNLNLNLNIDKKARHRETHPSAGQLVESKMIGRQKQQEMEVIEKISPARRPHQNKTDEVRESSGKFAWSISKKHRFKKLGPQEVETEVANAMGRNSNSKKISKADRCSQIPDIDTGKQLNLRRKQPKETPEASKSFKDTLSFFVKAQRQKNTQNQRRNLFPHNLSQKLSPKQSTTVVLSSKSAFSPENRRSSLDNNFFFAK